MAKSGRKRKRAEKSKTKLRQSIKLPKGLNETNSTVTAKKIIVLDQLRTLDQNDDKVTKKKIGIKDLMSKLNNTSTSIKNEALEGLLELFKPYPDLCREHLSSLLSSVFPLNVQIESKVRKNAREVLQTILQNVQDDQVEPLSPMVCAHVSCGLSHIDTNIQLDSLKLLDIIIENCPKVMKNGHKSILPNCLDQVSLKSKSTGDKNINSKVTALQWRTEVLVRVYKILKMVGENNKKSSKNLVKIGKIEDFYMDLTNFSADCLTLQDILEYKNGTKNDDFYAQFKVGLNTILFDTWCEATAMSDDKKSNKKNSIRNLIQAEILPTLSVIIELLLISENYTEKILNGITKNFPFEVILKNNSNDSADDLNLTICLLVLNGQNYNDLVAQFLTNIKVTNNLQASKVSLILLKMLQTDKIQDMNSTIEQLVNNYSHNENVAELMLELSCSAKKDDIPAVKNWIESLPETVISAKVTKSHLEAVRTLFKRRDHLMINAFQSLEKLPPISLKQPGLLEQVWRILALLKVKVSLEEQKCAINQSSISLSTKNYVCNLLSAS